MSQLFKPGTRETRFFSFTRAIDRKARTVELSFSSETPIERSWRMEILDHGKKSVRLGRLRAGGPLLVDHDARDIVGVIGNRSQRPYASWVVSQCPMLSLKVSKRSYIAFGKRRGGTFLWRLMKDSGIG